MTHMKVLIVSAALLACTGLAGARENPASQPAQPQANVVIAHVNGLVCDFCAQSVRKLIGREEAVQDVQVDLAKGEVEILMRTGQTLDDATIEKLVRKSGYSLTSIERGGSE